MEKHFVTFCSPGTFFHEYTQKEIDTWDVAKAVKMSKKINERYNSKPFGFYFTTRTRGDDDFDSKETAHSKMYYLNAKVETLAEIEARNDPNDKTLISNMKCNDWDKIVTNNDDPNVKNWKWTQPLQEGDTVL